MLNFRELIDWLDIHCKDWESIVKEDRYDLYPFDTPMKYRGIYKKIGHAYIWNDVGGIDLTINMYTPVEGGTVLYDVDNAS